MIDYSEWKENVTEDKNKPVCHVSMDNGTDLWFTPTKGRFPNYTKVIPSFFACTCRIQRAPLLRSLDRMSFLCPGNGKIRVKLSSDKMTLYSKDKDFETEQTETLPCEYKSKPMELGITIRNVIPILSSIRSKDVLILSTGKPSQVFVVTPEKQPENETITALFMPCHIGED